MHADAGPAAVHLEASKRKNASLESAISGLTLRLKEQDMLRLELQLELQSCRSAMSTFSAELSHTEVCFLAPPCGALQELWRSFCCLACTFRRELRPCELYQCDL